MENTFAEFSRALKTNVLLLFSVHPQFLIITAVNKREEVEYKSA
jgi:hypothetical protein